MLEIKKMGLFFIVIIMLSSCTTWTIKEKDFLRSAPYKMSVEKAEVSKEGDQIIFSWQKSDTLFSDSSIKIDLQEIKINDSTTVEYFNFSSLTAKRNLIFFPANAHNILYFSNFLRKLAQKLDLNIIALHYRGYGNSSGEHSFKTCFDDNQEMYDILKTTALNPSLSTDVIGISVGSVYATTFAVENKEIENLILMSPHSSVENAIEQQMSNIPLIMRPFIFIEPEESLYKIDNIQKLNNYKRGLLIFQSKDDSDMTKNGGNQLFEASLSKKKDLLLFEKGGHFSPIKEEYFEKVSNKIKSFIY